MVIFPSSPSEIGETRETVKHSSTFSNDLKPLEVFHHVSLAFHLTKQVKRSIRLTVSQ
jgi:hypothetical protein